MFQFYFRTTFVGTKSQLNFTSEISHLKCSNSTSDFTCEMISVNFWTNKSLIIWSCRTLKAPLHTAIFAYDCCMQLADAIPATLCHLSRRYDYCMRLFQPRDILDPLSSFFFTLSWSHFEQEAYQFRFLSSYC